MCPSNRMVTGDRPCTPVEDTPWSPPLSLTSPAVDSAPPEAAICFWGCCWLPLLRRLRVLSTWRIRALGVSCLKSSKSSRSFTNIFSDCEGCPSGEYQDESGGGSQCKTCGAGQYATDALSKCKNCEEGKYQEQSSATEYKCKFCFEGAEYTSSTTICRQCNNGKYQNENNSTNAQCKSCSSGQYAVDATESCKYCLLGKYQAPQSSVFGFAGRTPSHLRKAEHILSVQEEVCRSVCPFPTGNRNGSFPSLVGLLERASRP